MLKKQLLVYHNSVLIINVYACKKIKNFKKVRQIYPKAVH